MAITHRDTQKATGTTTAVVTKPTGTADGDLLVAMVYSFAGVIGAPAGWTSIRDANPSGSFHLGTFYRVASGEGATFTFTGTTATGAIVSCFTGFTAAVLDVEGGTNNASSVNACAPSITTTANNDLLFWAGGHATTASTTPPSGMTEPTNGDTGTVISVAYLLDAGTAGATGDKTGTLSVASTNSGFLAAFKSVSDTNVAVPVSTATALAPVPTVIIKPLPPTATATALAQVPTVRVVVPPPVATATALARVPTVLLGPLTVVAPTATATALARVPSVVLGPVSLSVPVSTATAAALVPAVLIGPITLAVPISTATAAALAPLLVSGPVLLAIPTATATAEALVPEALAYVNVSAYGRVDARPSIICQLSVEKVVQAHTDSVRAIRAVADRRIAA